MEIGLVGLLRTLWIAGILPIVIVSVPCSRMNLFHGVLMGFTKRGKIMQSSSHKFTVPQRFFLHFYAMAVVWTSLLLLSAWIYAYTTAPLASQPILYSSIANHLTGSSHVTSSHKSLTPVGHRYKVWCSVFLLLLMEVQVLRRLFESICVFKYSPSARMHIFGYLTGLYIRVLIDFCVPEVSFYTAAPLSLCCTPEVFKFAANQVAKFIFKGNSLMPAIEFDWWEFVNPLMKLGWLQWIGAAVFFWGWIHQRRCHAILGSLRESPEQSGEYVVPRGDWFETVSSPHYLAEIVIYAGLVLASGGADLTIWLLFGFVVANLVFAAAETHRWYHHKFNNYPSNRLAIIPYVF